VRLSDWEYTEEPAAEPEEGQVRVRVDYLSVDPAMRSWLDDRPSYVPPVKIGAVMRAAGIGTVIDSRHPDRAVGDTVHGVFGVQYSVLDGGADKCRTLVEELVSTPRSTTSRRTSGRR
jgi:NADPH-dependent curcumin reductase CurA